MIDTNTAATKSAKSPSAVEPCIRFTPTQCAARKKDRDARRKALRDQNARSKSLK
jgi:hypothetical protein